MLSTSSVLCKKSPAQHRPVSGLTAITLVSAYSLVFLFRVSFPFVGIAIV